MVIRFTIFGGVNGAVEVTVAVLVARGTETGAVVSAGLVVSGVAVILASFFRAADNSFGLAFQ